MTALIIAINALAAVVVMLQAVAVMNRMSETSCQTIAVAWVALGGAAIAELVDLVMVSRVPDWHSALVLSAVAWLGMVERRRRK